MIVVTGGAGFIGSAIVHRLNQLGENNILIVDHLADSEKWKNLVPLIFNDYMNKEDFICKLENGYFEKSIQAIFHLGACSSTTEKDAEYLIENNYRYTFRIAYWHENHPECRFIYASSAATYGDGSQGYSDDENQLSLLQPQNIYGYSKHLFDLMAKKRGWLSAIAGLKYFNVFGPNEYHKADMRSVINKAYPVIIDKGSISLFKSCNQNYKDGEQLRDFIYIKDAVEMTLFFYKNRNINGIFNIGTGIARTWNNVARAMFHSMNKKENIRYIDMPDILKNKYQYYTCAEMKKIRDAGCLHTCISLELAIEEYINKYLSQNKFLGME